MEACKEVKKCGLGFGVGVVVVMEVKQVGVRTRDRAMETLAEETEDNSGAVKRRKLSKDNLRSHSSMFVETKPVDCEIDVDSVLKEKQSGACDAVANGGSNGVPACCCSSAGSVEELKVSDLEEIVETGRTARHNLDGIESTPRSESTTAKKSKSCRKVLPAGIMPPEAELEEFFAAAQQGLNERFKNKYNYDIVNDIPLKGRYEWIQVTPEK